MASRSKKQATTFRPQWRCDPERKPAGSSGGNKSSAPGARPFVKGELDYEDKPERRRP